MTDNTDTRSPQEIEHDIRDTQREMNRTAQQLEGELSARNIFNALLDKADDSGVDARFMLDAARRNPLALGMIAAGGLWLVSDADARPSALKLPAGRSGSTGSGRQDTSGWHPEHHAYVEHMSRCERQPDEDDQAYRRRRDHSRASYFMLEQGHDEDEGTFRKRLDEATDKLRERRDRASEQFHDIASRSRDSTRHATAKAKDFYVDSPLLSGLAAAFVGAMAGSALPSTRTEENYVGGMGEQAIDTARDQMHKAGDKARQSKDDMIDKVDRKVGASAGQDQQGSRYQTA